MPWKFKACSKEMMDQMCRPFEWLALVAGNDQEFVSIFAVSIFAFQLT